MPYWSCVQLEPKRERLALHCLTKVNGFEVYSPRIRIKAARLRRGDNLTRPLFPGYAFVLIVLQWHAARWSPGVVRIVLDGSVPAKVPDRIIAELRERECEGIVQLPEAPRMQPGGRVRVCGGPFAGHLGLYAGMKPRERVDILLQLLGSTCRVTLAASDVARVTVGGAVS